MQERQNVYCITTDIRGKAILVKVIIYSDTTPNLIRVQEFSQSIRQNYHAWYSSHV